MTPCIVRQKSTSFSCSSSALRQRDEGRTLYSVTTIMSSVSRL